VLPASYREWSREKLRMVLAHERVHVRQGDFYVQLAAGLYAAVFWPSPLGWWLRRTLASLGEAMADRAGLESAESGAGYAQVLLEFAAMPRQGLAGVAMARPGNLTGRVERMLNEGAFRRAFAEGRRRAMASLLVIPVAVFAATALVRVPGAAAQTVTPEAAPAPTAQGAKPSPSTPMAVPAAEPAPRTGQAFAGEGPDAGQVREPAESLPGPAPVPTAAMPIPPAATRPVLPAAPVAPAEKGDSWALVHGGSGAESLSGRMTFSGQGYGEQMRDLERARKMAHGPFLWFRHDGKSYIVTDPAVVARVQALYAPMTALGKRQRLLGQTEANLAAEQRAMAEAIRKAERVKMPDMRKLMAQVQAEVQAAQKQLAPERMAAIQAEVQAELSPEKMAEMEAQIKRANGELTSEDMAKIQAQLKAELSPAKMAAMQAKIQAAEQKWNAQAMAEMQKKLAEAQARLHEAQGNMEARQGAFSQRMSRLGAEQGKLGAEQGRLGAEQERMARQMDRSVRGIIEQSLRNGTATPVR
jgi:hypothetical protein